MFVDDNVKTGDSGPGAAVGHVPGDVDERRTIVEGTTDGTFTYTPDVGFAGPTDTFTYTLTDGNGVTNTGTVTINLSNVVWYVNSAGGNGDGRSHNPFNTLNAAATPSGVELVIYVHTGGATTPGNLAMDANQTLHGQGATFTPEQPDDRRGHASDADRHGDARRQHGREGRELHAGAIPAMTASGVADDAAGRDRSGERHRRHQRAEPDERHGDGTGAITVSNAELHEHERLRKCSISGGTVPVTFAATATISSNAGRSIDIQNRTGGTVAFNGAITDTGQGIFLNANTGSTINFTGGLSLSTASQPGVHRHRRRHGVGDAEQHDDRQHRSRRRPARR